MKFDSQKWDNKAFSEGERYANLLKKIHQQLIINASKLAASVNPKEGKPFSFADYPQLRDQVNKLFSKYVKDTNFTISNASKELWELANKKNDDLLNSVGEKYGEIKKAYRANGAANEKALKAFQQRRDYGLNLSDRVWRNADQAKQELELAIGVSLKDGISAATLAKSVKQYLNEPDKLFRKVRDKHGQLQLSKNAKAYHPGQGVYRSSYKNAMRLARTETNMAYRAGDFERWSRMDFVAGIEVKLSNNPNHCPTCVQLQGKYPKDFKFVGWHPQCRCFAVPVLITDKQFDELELAMLNDGGVSSFTPKNQVNNIPAGAKKWYRDNKDRVQNHKNLPYFLKDNPDHFSKVAGPIKKVGSFSFTDKSRAGLEALGFHITGSNESLNKFFTGFDFVKFDSEMKAIADKYGIKISEKKIIVKEGEAYFTYENGGKNFRLWRTVSISRGVKTVSHDLFTVPKNLQGAGISKDIFESLYRQYQSAGIERIEVHANIDVGGYAWGKYGFAADGRNSINDVVRRAHRKLNENDLKDFSAWLESCEENDHFPMWELANRPYGKDVLLNSDWYGHIDLRNDQQRQIFEDYLFSRK